MRTHSLRASWIATAVATALVLGAPVVTATNDDQGRAQNLQRAVRGAWSSGEPFVEPQPFARLPRLVDRADGDGSDGRTDRGSGPTPHLLVRIPRATTARARPAAGAAVVGTVPAGSKYYGVPTTAWVEETAKDGRWGRVEIPYVWPRRDGWIHLRGLARDRTNVQVHVDLSRHWVSVTKFGRVLFGLRAATGAPASPTPPGRYFVTDRIPFPAGGLAGIVRLRNLGDPAQPACRMERGEPAGDSRHGCPVVDRRQRERGMPAGQRAWAGPAHAAPAPGHARRRPTLRAGLVQSATVPVDERPQILQVSLRVPEGTRGSAEHDPQAFGDRTAAA